MRNHVQGVREGRRKKSVTDLLFADITSIRASFAIGQPYTFPSIPAEKTTFQYSDGMYS